MTLGHDKQHGAINYSSIHDGEGASLAVFCPPWQGRTRFWAFPLLVSRSPEIRHISVCHETSPFLHVPLSHVGDSVYFRLTTRQWRSSAPKRTSIRASLCPSTWNCLLCRAERLPW